MESVAVVTLVTSPQWQELASLTLPTQRAYASRMRADFVVLDRKVYPHPHYDKWQIHGLLERYERVLFVDADVVIRADCPDLFLMVPPECVGGENELKSYPGQAGHFKTFVDRAGWPQTVCPFYLNGGVFVAGRAHRAIFRPPEFIFEDLPWPEQTHFNVRLVRESVPVYFLNQRFNDRHRTGNYLRESFMLHYSVMSMPQRLEAVRRDLAAWDAMTRRRRPTVFSESVVTETLDP